MSADVLNSSSGKYGRTPDVYKMSAQTADFTAVDGFCYLVTKLDGCDVTLPAPTVGAKIKIVFGAVTSNAHTITCDATTTLYEGYALVIDTIDGTPAQHVVFAADESDDDAISMNGTTTGASAVYELTGISTNRWQVEGIVYASGAVATVFA